MSDGGSVQSDDGLKNHVFHQPDLSARRQQCRQATEIGDGRKEPTSCHLAEIAEGGEDTLEGEAEPEHHHLVSNFQKYLG